MYANRRRSHVHIIVQRMTRTGEYTGKRVVIYTKGVSKIIFDVDSFKPHKYKNPKDKKHSTTLWERKKCGDNNIIKKEMCNLSDDGVYEMCHFIYEKLDSQMDDLIEYALGEHGIKFTDDLREKIKQEIHKN